MERLLQELVRRRAGGICEYCRHPAPPFHIEHIIARKHGGLTAEDNLALACVRCNFHKGPNLSGIDPLTHQIVRLFHPRKDTWAEHFRFEGARLIGLTAVGRATVTVLAINDSLRVEIRARLITQGRFE